MPIDSEHGAIYQCLLGEDAREVARLWVTASGGPFRGRTRGGACAHHARPGARAPHVEHGREDIHRLVHAHEQGARRSSRRTTCSPCPTTGISVVVQPQSAIHSMVEYSDGSVKAHLGTTDMRIPIQFALSYPERWDAPVEPLDFTQAGLARVRRA